MDEEVQERKPVTVGKPLVSKLNLHEPRPSHVSPAYSSVGLDSLNVSESCSFAEEFDSVDSASTTWSNYTQTGSTPSISPATPRSANIPEETDCPELFHTPQPLVASKSLPLSQVNDTNYKFSDMYNFHSY